LRGSALAPRAAAYGAAAARGLSSTTFALPSPRRQVIAGRPRDRALANMSAIQPRPLRGNRLSAPRQSGRDRFFEEV
jgi:hypothetical protein